MVRFMLYVIMLLYAHVSQLCRFSTNKMFDQNHTILVAEGDVANDVAIQMLFDREGEAILLYASAASEFEQCEDGQAWNCTLWEGFGEKYA